MSEEISRLLLTISASTFLVISSILAVRLYLLLDNFKKTLGKLDKVLDDASVVSDSIARPVAAISALVSGFKGGSSIVKKLLGK